jgi:hypothetical protein
MLGTFDANGDLLLRIERTDPAYETAAEAFRKMGQDVPPAIPEETKEELWVVLPDDALVAEKIVPTLPTPSVPTIASIDVSPLADAVRLMTQAMAHQNEAVTKAIAQQSETMKGISTAQQRQAEVMGTMVRSETQLLSGLVQIVEKQSEAKPKRKFKIGWGDGEEAVVSEQ